MKQSLQLKLGQQLVMTPQLQQAIKLLQLSTLDLQQEIQEALDTNPMLEMLDGVDSADDGDSSGEEVYTGTGDETINGNGEALTADARIAEANDTSGHAEPNGNNDSGDSGSDNGSDNSSDESLANGDVAAASTDSQDTFSDTIPDELPVDSHWDDVYTSGSSGVAPAADSDYDLDSRNSVGESLADHLLWQLNLTRFSDTDRCIALAIIDATDDNGRLTTTLEEIWEPLAEDLDVEMDEAVAVLHRLQQFDPPGVCTHDLRECLLVQLQQLPIDTPYLNEAKLVINRYMNLLGNRDYAQLIRRSKIREPELKSVLELIQTLNPNPGASVGEDNTEYVVPDVFVSKKNGAWVVELNPDIAPKLRINEGYAGLVKRADNSADNTYMRDSLQEARWFLKSLQSRNETLMKVATCIVEHQRGFLEYGEEAMKPLVLHDIAEDVDMHESTISRVTTQKYMHTPRGIFELKYFFSSHVSTAAGGECSSTAIRALIKKLIAAENPRKPLSDSKITGLLEEQGIKVARRTIAKYRESLVIPPSNERKRLV